MFNSTQSFVKSFFSLMMAACLLFFISVRWFASATEVVKYMNDIHTTKTPLEWVLYIFGAIFFSGLWCFFWVVFKRAEKQCVELSLKTKPLSNEL